MISWGRVSARHNGHSARTLETQWRTQSQQNTCPHADGAAGWTLSFKQIPHWCPRCPVFFCLSEGDWCISAVASNSDEEIPGTRSSIISMYSVLSELVATEGKSISSDVRFPPRCCRRCCWIRRRRRHRKKDTWIKCATSIDASTVVFERAAIAWKSMIAAMGLYVGRLATMAPVMVEWDEPVPMGTTPSWIFAPTSRCANVGYIPFQ